jgi:hypothetical protein
MHSYRGLESETKVYSGWYLFGGWKENLLCGEQIMKSLWELDVSKVRCGLIAFTCRLSRTAVSPKLAFREAGMKVSPVTMSRPSLRTSALPCLPL